MHSRNVLILDFRIDIKKQVTAGASGKNEKLELGRNWRNFSLSRWRARATPRDAATAQRRPCANARARAAAKLTDAAGREAKIRKIGWWCVRCDSNKSSREKFGKTKSRASSLRPGKREGKWKMDSS